MSRQDEIAARAVRKSTLTSLKVKKAARLRKLKNDYEAEVRKVNIEYSKDPERLKAKYAADQYAKNERAKRRAARRIDREQKTIDMLASQRQYSLAEEIAASIVQGIGAAIAITFLVLFEALVVDDIKDYRELSIVLYTVFGGATILMYILSVLHHALKNVVAKEVFKRLSHAFTFVMIGVAYAAYSITQIQGTIGWVLFGIVVGVCLIGAILYSIFGSKFEKGIIAFYCVAGWSGLLAAKILYSTLSVESFAALCGAGVMYLIATVFYSLRKIRWMHFIGNCIMLLGSLSLFFSIIQSIL